MNCSGSYKLDGEWEPAGTLPEKQHHEPGQGIPTAALLPGRERWVSQSGYELGRRRDRTRPVR